MAIRPLLAGLAAGLAVLVLLHVLPGTWREVQRERSFDLLLGLNGREPAPLPVVVVDIDSASLEALGPWPWPRDRTAALIARIAEAGPAAIGLDVLLAGPDRSSPAALARRLAELTGRDDLSRLAAGLPDGDAALAQAVRGAPTALAFVLDAAGQDAPPETAILIRGESDAAIFTGLWGETGITASPPGVAAAGAGSISLPGDADGVVRRVPVLVEAAGQLAPGLATELLRLKAGASGYILSGPPARLDIGGTRVPLPPDAMVRLLPSPWHAASVSAASLDRPEVRARLVGATVLIGSSAPELGGLRATASDPLTPSVQIHAMALRQMAGGVLPLRPSWAVPLEAGIAALLAALAAVLGSRLRPLAGAAAALALLALAGGGAALAAARDILLDPTAPLASGAAAFLAAALAAFAVTRAREARIRRRFEQHLAPGVVARILANPQAVKLDGERREITALFTDIEGFTGLTRDLGPQDLVRLLDDYFEGVSAIIVAHGGMIDKFVGDAVHAFFNAPLDLPGHAARAIECAARIVDWSETFRRHGAAAAAGLGRTRIGIETGEAVVGEVGLGAKLDYTAHGDAVNMAARLEALNKELGTAVCIGPRAAALSQRGDLVSLGKRDIRGLGAFELFSLVPAAATATTKV